MIGNGTSALRKANVYSRPLNFTAVFTKFYVLMACLFTACSLGPVAAAVDWKGTKERVAPVSTRKSLLDFSSLIKLSFVVAAPLCVIFFHRD
jgi:hypothetical protein